ncbi:MAG: response regulator transcription factor [Eubacterium sp.]|nr:response regulator transcription factor [Eubacterium sp.]
MKVVIVDDDRLVAMSLKTIVESDKDIEVLATGNSGEEAINLYDEYDPDVLLMDIRMAGMTGLEAGEEILNKHADAKILYLTTFNDDEYIVKALSIGAKGYIIKQDFDSIVPSLKTVFSGQTVFGNEITEKLPNILLRSTNSGEASEETIPGNVAGDFSYESHGLTEQEFQIVKCVADGLSNKEIADTLFLSEGTVRNYISNILSKLELRDRTNLAIFYYKAINRQN